MPWSFRLRAIPAPPSPVAAVEAPARSWVSRWLPETTGRVGFAPAGRANMLPTHPRDARPAALHRRRTGRVLASRSVSVRRFTRLWRGADFPMSMSEPQSRSALILMSAVWLPYSRIRAFDQGSGQGANNVAVTLNISSGFFCAISGGQKAMLSPMGRTNTPRSQTSRTPLSRAPRAPRAARIRSRDQAEVAAIDHMRQALERVHAVLEIRGQRRRARERPPRRRCPACQRRGAASDGRIR